MDRLKVSHNVVWQQRSCLSTTTQSIESLVEQIRDICSDFFFFFK